MSTKFKKGDRVKFPRDVYEWPFIYMYGTVIEVYSYWSKFLHIFYPELYAVKWDNKETINYSYLPHGLERE